MTPYWRACAMRNTDPLTEELRRWGHAQVNRFALSRAERGVHVLDKARDFAPRTPERALRELIARDGADRRRLMAAATGVKGLRIVPMWAADPVRASNDADHPHDNPEIAVDVGIPDELRWVDRALSSLHRHSLLRAIIVRVEFTSAVSQAIKARMACELFEKEMALRLGIELSERQQDKPPALTTRQYRYELSRALDLLRGMRWTDAA